MTVRLFKAFATLAVVLAGLNAVLLLSHNRQDPIAGPMLTEALNSPVRPGDKLAVRITRDKTRSDCPVTSFRTFVDTNGRKTPGGVAVRQSGGLPNAQSVVWRYLVPTHIAPGQYELRVSLRYDCPRGLTFHHEQEPVLLRVAPDALSD